MRIEKNKDLSNWLSETMEDLRIANLPTYCEPCCHCGLQIKRPLVARESDIELFNKIMTTAYAVMDRHGITANLLAEIKADCVINIAKTYKGKKGE